MNEWQNFWVNCPFKWQPYAFLLLQHVNAFKQFLYLLNCKQNDVYRVDDTTDNLEVKWSMLIWLNKNYSLVFCMHIRKLLLKRDQCIPCSYRCMRHNNTPQDKSVITPVFLRKRSKQTRSNRLMYAQEKYRILLLNCDSHTCRKWHHKVCSKWDLSFTHTPA